MKFKTITFGAILALLLGVVPAFSQTTTTETTLSSAVLTPGTDQIVVSSATGIVAGRQIYIDRELMQVKSSYVSGTTIPVLRARAGIVSPHLSGAKVVVGIPGNYAPATGTATGGVTVGVFLPENAAPYGPCSTTAQQYTVVVNVKSGNRYQCIVDSFSIIGGPDSQVKIVIATAQTAAIANVDSTFFEADRPYKIIGVTEIHNTIEDSAGNWQLSKDSSTNAPGAGVDLLTSGFDLTATTRVAQTGTLVTTAGYIHLAAGDRLAWDASATLDTVTGVVMTVTLVPE